MKKIVVAAVFAARFTPAGLACRRVDAPPVARTHMRRDRCQRPGGFEDETMVLARGKIVSIAVAASANIRREAQAVATHNHLIYPVSKDGMGYVSTELMRPARGEVGGR